jgi:hypothetical protein
LSVIVTCYSTEGGQLWPTSGDSQFIESDDKIGHFYACSTMSVISMTILLIPEGRLNGQSSNSPLRKYYNNSAQQYRIDTSETGNVFNLF